MARFEEMLSTRQDEIGGEIFDLLLSFGNFDEFKDMMLSYKRMRAPAKSLDLSVQGSSMVGGGRGGNGGLCISGSSGLGVTGLSIQGKGSGAKR